LEAANVVIVTDVNDDVLVYIARYFKGNKVILSAEGLLKRESSTIISDIGFDALLSYILSKNDSSRSIQDSSVLMQGGTSSFSANADLSLHMIDVDIDYFKFSRFSLLLRDNYFPSLRELSLEGGMLSGHLPLISIIGAFSVKLTYLFLFN
jgi:hypothetical protein